LVKEDAPRHNERSRRSHKQQRSAAASNKTRVALLGSTGSIGRQAIEVVTMHSERFEVVALAAGSDRDGLARQASDLGVERRGLGAEAAVELATVEDADVVLNAVVGAAGLKASVAALRSGKTLALANKESLVAGGEVCLAAAREGGGTIVPVDSEHAAISQCLAGRDRASVSRVVLTASGGPFRERANLESVTPQEALAHPTWSMGPKITIDSATLMNKGLEVIEAHFLFGLDYDLIDVVVHPQSVVHGIVEFADGSSLMQAAPPDMRIPILAALNQRPALRPQEEAEGPGRLPLDVPPADLAGLGRLAFEPVDRRRFPALDLAYEAGRRGGTHPAALNAANEEAVAAFLDEALPFTGIPAVIEQVVAAHQPRDAATLEGVLDADRAEREEARRVISRLSERAAP
jgi:1-deoxy-D-xylulose-5-phosphate reductoisomerase